MGAIAAALVFQAVSAAARTTMGNAAKPLSKVTTIDVTAGKPSEFSFTLSKTSLIPAGTVIFRVTNKGKLYHTFKVCTSSSGGDTDSCTGRATTLLGPGESTSLTMQLEKGEYEYLCSVPGHAAAGMKGVIGVGVKATALAPFKMTVVDVTAGRPTEFAFQLSESSKLPVGNVTFEVTNKGKIPHSFKICTSPTAGTANSCVGVATNVMKPGQVAVLTVKLTTGTHEYLCTVPGHAAAGMKGVLGVGVATATTTLPTPTPTPTPTTTTTAAPPPPVTKPPATEPLGGDPVDGASVFASAGCTSCHTLAAAGSTGTIGPDLDSIANELTQALIVNQVTNGGQTMPSFAQSLTPTQINDVAAYVYQSTHA